MYCLPANYPDLPQLIVVSVIQDEEAGGDDAEHVEAHLDEVTAVVEQGHSREHDYELKDHANEENNCDTRQTTNASKMDGSLLGVCFNVFGRTCWKTY